MVIAPAIDPDTAAAGSAVSASCPRTVGALDTTGLGDDFLSANAGFGFGVGWDFTLGAGFGSGAGGDSTLGLGFGFDAGFSLGSGLAGGGTWATGSTASGGAGANSATAGVAGDETVAEAISGTSDVAATDPVAPPDWIARAGNSITVTGNGFGGVEGSAMIKVNPNPATPRCASADNPAIASRCPRPGCMIASALWESQVR